MIRLIGLGSPFGDDRIGWELIAALGETPPPDTELLALDRPGAGLVSHLAGADRVILVDAVLAPPPGRILHLQPAALGSHGTRLNSHGLDLAQALALADRLGCLPPRVDIYGITIADTRRRSRRARAAVPRLAAELRAAIGRARVPSSGSIDSAR